MFEPGTDNREHNAGLAIGGMAGGGKLTAPRTRMPGYGMRPQPVGPEVRGSKKGGFIQKAEKRMEAKGTEGSFSAAARRHKMSTQAYAAKVIKDLKGKKNLTKRESTLLKRAVFARNMKKIGKHRK